MVSLLCISNALTIFDYFYQKITKRFSNDIQDRLVKSGTICIYLKRNSVNDILSYRNQNAT